MSFSTVQPSHDIASHIRAYHGGHSNKQGEIFVNKSFSALIRSMVPIAKKM